MADTAPSFFRWTASSDGRVLDIDERWATHAGVHRDVALGEGWTALFAPGDIARLATAATRARDENGMFVIEAGLLRHQHEPSPVVICGVAVTQDGVPVGYTGVVILVHAVAPPAVVAGCVTCGDVRDAGGQWTSLARAVVARWQLEPATCPRCATDDSA